MREFTSEFQLPAGLMSTTLRISDGPETLLVVSENPGRYEALWVEKDSIGRIAEMVIDCLRGTGTLIDVGANIGTIALPVAMSGSNTVAIEMMPGNVRKLRASVLINRLSNVRIIHAAASDDDKMVTYFGEEAWGTIGSGTKEAAASSLDSLCSLLELGEPGFIKSPVFLKIDVESHEPQVMSGSAGLIAAFRPHVIFESIDFDDERGKVADLSKSIITDMDYSLYLLGHSSNIASKAEPGDMQIGLVSDYLAVPNEQCDGVAERIPNFVFRPLRDGEIIQRLMEDVNHLKEHRTHVFKYLKRYFRHVTLPSAYIRVLEALVNHESFESKEEAEFWLSSARTPQTNP